MDRVSQKYECDYVKGGVVEKDSSHVVDNIVRFSHKLRGRNQIQKNQLPLHIIRVLPCFQPAPVR